MTSSAFLSRLDAARAPLLADGAMGTMLHAGGVAFNTCFDALNLTDPATVAEVHHAYVEAGSDVILTNTFGANRYKLDEHGLADQVCAINRAGVQLARRVVLAAFREVLVAGDIGPLGVRLAPYGRVQVAQAREAFVEQIGALAEAGPDLLVIETMTDLEESLAAVGRRPSDRGPATLRGRCRRHRRELLGWPGTTAADPRADACCRARRALLGEAQRWMARAGLRPHSLPGDAGVLWRVYLGVQEGGG